MITALRTATWVCVALLAILSLLPGEDMVRTGMSGHIEHFVAYAGTAIIATTAYGPGGLRTVGLLWAYAGLLEWLQHYSPGRHPAVTDFLSSSLGVLCGAVAVIVFHHAVRHFPFAR